MNLYIHLWVPGCGGFGRTNYCSNYNIYTSVCIINASAIRCVLKSKFIDRYECRVIAAMLIRLFDYNDSCSIITPGGWELPDVVQLLLCHRSDANRP